MSPRNQFCARCHRKSLETPLGRKDVHIAVAGWWDTERGEPFMLAGVAGGGGLHTGVFIRVSEVDGHSQHGSEKPEKSKAEPGGQKECQHEIFYVWRGFILDRASKASVTLMASGLVHGKTCGQ